jgi:hypothetical protein
MTANNKVRFDRISCRIGAYFILFFAPKKTIDEDETVPNETVPNETAEAVSLAGQRHDCPGTDDANGGGYDGMQRVYNERACGMQTGCKQGRVRNIICLNI